MKDLLAFLISEITGAKSAEDFTVSEDTVEGKTILNVVSKPNIIGLIIGKEGKTIKNITNPSISPSIRWSNFTVYCTANGLTRAEAEDAGGSSPKDGCSKEVRISSAANSSSVKLDTLSVSDGKVFGKGAQ